MTYLAPNPPAVRFKAGVLLFGVGSWLPGTARRGYRWQGVHPCRDGYDNLSLSIRLLRVMMGKGIQAGAGAPDCSLCGLFGRSVTTLLDVICHFCSY